MVKLAVLGLGFMGQTHLQSIRNAQREGLDVELVAVCDRNDSRLDPRAGAAGNMETTSGEPLFDPTAILATTSFEELLGHDEVEGVVICTHTDTHVDMATRALEAGKHVLLEKPVATTAAEVAALLQRVGDRTQPGQASPICMPAMCMRYWPGWSSLRDTIMRGENGEAYGALRSLHARRLGARPDWGGEFYGDSDRCGGAIVDLHIHDVDFVYWCLGRPESVTSVGSRQHLTSCYRYGDRPQLQVVAEGGWVDTPNYPFHMGYTAHFERGTVEYDSSAAQPLRVISSEGVEFPELDAATGYDGELRHFLEVVQGRRELGANLEQAHIVMEMIEAEERSLQSGKPESVSS